MANVDQRKPVPLSIPQSMVLGAASAAIAGTCIFPLDKAKTRLQNSSGASIGLSRTLGNIVRVEGWASLFRGLGPQLIGIAPEKAVKLTVNNYLRMKLKDPKTGVVSVGGEVTAGCLTAIVQAVITNPYERFVVLILFLEV
jgi:solute carrier family 25 aspartate/glutamate transporter 12/13